MGKIMHLVKKGIQRFCLLHAQLHQLVHAFGRRGTEPTSEGIVCILICTEGSGSIQLNKRATFKRGHKVQTHRVPWQPERGLAELLLIRQGKL